MLPYKNMVLLKELSIPFMQVSKTQLATINNWSKIHWARKSKIKNNYKRLIKDWFLDDTILPKDSHFVFEPVYTDNRKRDAVNVAPTIKVFEDCLTELGLIEDDDETSHCTLPRRIDKSLSAHRLYVKIYKRNINERK